MGGDPAGRTSLHPVWLTDDYGNLMRSGTGSTIIVVSRSPNTKHHIGMRGLGRRYCIPIVIPIHCPLVRELIAKARVSPSNRLIM